MSTKRNLLEYLEKKNITKADFYRKAGLPNGFLDKSDTVNSRNLGKILSAFEDLSPDWLLTGTGEMLRHDPSHTRAGESTQVIENHGKNIKNIIRTQKGIPLIPVEAMAGYANGDIQVMGYEIQEDYIITPELENKGVKYLIRASGSSMQPKYNNGDILACRPITDVSFMQWGKVYVLDTDQGPLVKRLYECKPADESSLECHSDNFERYPPFKINKTSIRSMAIVVGVLRLE